MSAAQRIALVSGANRGIGHEIARQLARAGLIVIGTSRDATKGEAASRQAMKAGESAGGRVLAKQLDVADQSSVDRLAHEVREEFGCLDVLVNNAGVYIDGQQRAVGADIDIVRRTLETNLYGAWRLCAAFIPLMRERGYGRVVNVSSGMGQLANMGGDSPAYRVSKTALNALTCVLAAELRGTNVLVNSADPGWVRTEMGGSQAPRTVEQGADTPVWLATLPDDGPTGGFFSDRQSISW